MTSADTRSTTLAQELIEAVATVLGSCPGHRVTHTKGVTLTGTFTATPRARELSRAAHLQGEPVRVTVRFSNGDPNPMCPDAAENDPRGMAVKFYLPDGSTTDVVCQSWPAFPTGTPEEFLAFIRAQGEGPEAFDGYLAANPKVAAAAAAIGAAGDPPRSWATMIFNSLVAYRLVNASGTGGSSAGGSPRRPAWRACRPPSGPPRTATT
ncbi:MAG: catalase [Pseudonocardia sp.]